jgi:hypothetical protein
MMNALLLACVLGVVLVAVITDIGALVAWLRRWR